MRGNYEELNVLTDLSEDANTPFCSLIDGTISGKHAGSACPGKVWLLKMIVNLNWSLDVCHVQPLKINALVFLNNSNHLSGIFLCTFENNVNFQFGSAPLSWLLFNPHSSLIAALSSGETVGLGPPSRPADVFLASLLFIL